MKREAREASYIDDWFVDKNRVVFEKIENFDESCSKMFNLGFGNLLFKKCGKFEGFLIISDKMGLKWFDIGSFDSSIGENWIKPERESLIQACRYYIYLSLIDCVSLRLSLHLIAFLAWALSTLNVQFQEMNRGKERERKGKTEKEKDRGRERKKKKRK